MTKAQQEAITRAIIQVEDTCSLLDAAFSSTLRERQPEAVREARELIYRARQLLERLLK
jgi:hypothetical protein